MQLLWWRWSVGSVLLMLASWAVIERPWQTRENPPAPSKETPVSTPATDSKQPEQVAVIPREKPLPELPHAKPAGPQRYGSFTLSDDEVKQLMLGSWEQDYYGRRVLTVREDGTATMQYYPAGVFRQKIYGEELTVEFDWTLADGVITLTSTGGSPAAKIQLATALYGKERVQPIIELTAETFQLLGVNGQEPDPAWQRVEPQVAEP